MVSDLVESKTTKKPEHSGFTLAFRVIDAYYAVSLSYTIPQYSKINKLNLFNIISYEIQPLATRF